MNQEIIKEIFGWVTVFLTATQFVPQAVKSIRTKSTRDLSWGTFILTVVISALWIFFGIWRGSLEIVAANVVVNVFCLMILLQKYYIERPKIDFRAITLGISFIVLLAAAIAVPSSLLRAVLGWAAVALNIAQFMPQAWKSLKTKSTKDLSWWSFIQIFVITIMWTLYGIWNGLPEVIITNAIVNIVIDAILVRKYLSEKGKV